jgi:hypothetical protein
MCSAIDIDGPGEMHIGSMALGCEVPVKHHGRPGEWGNRRYILRIAYRHGLHSEFLLSLETLKCWEFSTSVAESYNTSVYAW